jgi:hypothetical protein
MVCQIYAWVKNMARSQQQQRPKRRFNAASIHETSVSEIESAETQKQLLAFSRFGFGINYSIALTGATGTGKSTGLQHLATKLLPSNIVITVPLSGPENRGLLHTLDQAVLEAGFKDVPRLRDPKQAVRFLDPIQYEARQKGKKVIFLFDGVEHMDPKSYMDFIAFYSHSAGPFGERSHTTLTDTQFVYTIDPTKIPTLEKTCWGSTTPYYSLSRDVNNSLHVEQQNFSFSEIYGLVERYLSRGQLPPTIPSPLRGIAISLQDHLYGYPRATISCLKELSQMGEKWDLENAKNVIAENGRKLVEYIVQNRQGEGNSCGFVLNTCPETWEYPEDYTDHDSNLSNLSWHTRDQGLVDCFVRIAQPRVKGVPVTGALRRVAPSDTRWAPVIGCLQEHSQLLLGSP